MGVILDSSILVAAERKDKTARDVLAAVSSQVGDEEAGLSVITLLELAHGAARANAPERRTKREQFIAELALALPVFPVTASVALRAGQIDGENQSRGVRLPLADLLIGVTALELGYGVVTGNLRHFRLIQGLSVLQY
jgi:predicted nucleic acid-binding protein